MELTKTTRSCIGALTLGLAASPVHALAQAAPSNPKGVTPAVAEEVKRSPQVTPEQQKELAKTLSEKTAEMESLKSKAIGVTKSLGELANSGKLPTSEEAIVLMRRMVEEMSSIRENLGLLQEEIQKIKAWMSRQDESLPKMSQSILDLKKNKSSSYIQTQFRDTNQKGGASDAFSVRRMRIGATQTVDPRTSLKFSFDLATGTAGTAAQMRDAFVIYDVEPSGEKVGFQITAGQHPLPLGYELGRSSSEREFPERAIYNQRMFSGERSRGLNLKYGIAKGAFIHVGGWNALSVNDPEQSALAPGPESRLATTAGLRLQGKHHEFGIAMFAGDRPKFITGTGGGAVTHPRVDREFVYVDGAYTGLFDPKLYVRAEGMMGKDRVPVTGTPTSPRSQTDLAGYQLQMGYNLNDRNQIHVRYDQFDPDLDTAQDALQGYGVAWSYFLNPRAKVTLAYEAIDDPSRGGVGVRQQHYHISTIRVQFRF